MKKSAIVLSVVLGAAAVSAKPLALVGNDNEVQAVQSDITNRERIPSVVFLKSLPESYDDFAAVVFCGPTPRGVKTEDIPAGKINVSFGKLFQYFLPLFMSAIMR